MYEQQGLRMAKATGKNSAIIAGLDIGSTKVVCVVAAVSADGFNIVGVGSAVSTGMRQGVVVNIEETTESIRKACEEAELMSGYTIEDVWLGVSGSHIKSFASKGMIAIRNNEVAEEDIERVIEAAKAVAVPADKDVIHVVPREYRVDDQGNINDPIGMSGVRLEASVHIVLGGQTPLRNLIKCVEKSDLKVSGLVLQQLASALTVISEDERNLGVALVDIGGGTSDIIAYTEGSIDFTSVVPVGGMHFTQDISVGLRTPQRNAEELKKKHGVAFSSIVEEGETVEVPSVGGREPRSIEKSKLCEVIEPRAEETLKLIKSELEKNNLLDKLGAGVVLTGGASQLEGLSELAEFIFDVPVRKGNPTNVKGLTDIVNSPSFSTALGLIDYGLKQEKRVFEEEESISTSLSSDKKINSSQNILDQNGMIGKMKNFFNNIL